MAGALLSPIESGSRTERTVAVLTELITSGRFASGELLPSESELCKQLGISRPTVRMALRTLETRGLVVTRHGVGVQVTDRTRQVVTDSIELMLLRGGAGPRDMLEVRLMLECQGAALAADRATTADLAAIAEASQNAVLVALVHALRGLLRDTIAATWRVNDGVEERRRDHARVLDAVTARDPAAAVAAMRTHLCRTERLIEVMREGGAIPNTNA